MRRVPSVLAPVLLGLLASPTLASGYHPPFDQAVKEASWILLHEVLEAHTPDDVISGLPDDVEHRGEAYRIKVTRCFRGPFKPGDELLVWDPNHRSTAGYYLDANGPNLTFLQPPAELGWGGKPQAWYGSKAKARAEGRSLGVPIRNLKRAQGRGAGEGLPGWLWLLEQTKVGAAPLAPEALRAKLVDPATDTHLTHYLLSHWPAEGWEPADADLLRGVIERFKSTAWVCTAALNLLRKHGAAIGGESLKALLESCDPNGRGQLVKDVTQEEIADVRNLLWGWLAADELGAAESVEVLARLAPDFLRSQLTRTRLRFWHEIPALRALKQPPAELDRTYSAEDMTLEPWQLLQARTLAHDSTYGAEYALTQNDELWPRLLPLMVPLLPELDSEVRAKTVALLRSWGFSVQRKGDGAALGPRNGVPVKVTVKLAEVDSTKVQIEATALRPLLIAQRLRVSAWLHSADNANTIGSSGSHSVFPEDAVPKDGFVEAEKGEVVATHELDLTDWFEALEKSGASVPYRLEIRVWFDFDGLKHGLDAWTGSVAGKSLQLSPPR